MRYNKIITKYFENREKWSFKLQAEGRVHTPYCAWCKLLFFETEQEAIDSAQVVIDKKMKIHEFNQYCRPKSHTTKIKIK